MRTVRSILALGMWLALGRCAAAQGAPRPAGEPSRPPVAWAPPGADLGDRGVGADVLLARLLGDPKLFQERLGIDESQMRALKSAGQDMRKAQSELHAAMEEAAIQQARLLTQPAVDEEAILKLVEETGRLRTELAKLRMRQFLLLRRTLTPEQMEKAKTHMRERFREERQGQGPPERRGWLQHRRFSKPAPAPAPRGEPAGE